MDTKKAINVVFLDIDGVLLSGGDAADNEQAFNANYEYIKKKLGARMRTLDMFDIGATARFNPIAIENLKLLCMNYQAKIVISSMWRIDNDKVASMYKLTHLFKLWDLDHFIIDVTPTMFGSRAKEIQKWLDTTEHEVSSYVILDDIDDDLSMQFGEKFVNTEDAMYFSPKHYEQAVRVLEPQCQSTLGL
jgi:hypothetical protein